MVLKALRDTNSAVPKLRQNTDDIFTPNEELFPQIENPLRKQNCYPTLQQRPKSWHLPCLYLMGILIGLTVKPRFLAR